MSDDHTLGKLRQIADAIGIPVGAFFDRSAPRLVTESGMAPIDCPASVFPDRPSRDLDETVELLELWTATEDRQTRERVLSLLRNGASRTGILDEATVLTRSMRKRD